MIRLDKGNNAEYDQTRCKWEQYRPLSNMIIWSSANQGQTGCLGRLIMVSTGFKGKNKSLQQGKFKGGKGGGVT